MKPALRAAGAVAGGFGAAAILAVGVWVASWAVLAPRPPSAGRLAIPGLYAPVIVVRDRRGFPYVQARSLHDAYEAQGYLEAQDRLFQMDMLRRFASGKLAQVLGPALLSVDIRHRLIGPEQLAERMYAHERPAERAAVDAFTQGVNAAIALGPLPPEFRLLLYRPRPWRPEDSLLCGLATIVELTHTWNAIALRARLDERFGDAVAAALYPITDPRYDAPLSGKPAPVATMPPFPPGPRARARGAEGRPAADARGWQHELEASNEWAVGGAHTRSGRALLANDPHLDYTVPMVWYAIGLRAPGLDVVGASLPGLPGVVLGHNAHIAWGANDGTVSTVTLYRERVRKTSEGRWEVEDARTHRWVAVGVRPERIPVRGAKPYAFGRLTTPHGFLLLDGHGRLALPAFAAAWVPERDPRSPLATFLALDRARTIGAALAALRRYPGPPQSFVFADDRGRVAYHLAGLIPDDGVWGTRPVDGSRVIDAWRGFVPFDRLPHVNPSRDAVVFSANDRTYGAGYPYRLTDAFAPPYRAYRIRQLLGGRNGLTVADMESIQLDDLSLPEQELVRRVLAAVARHPEQHLDANALEPLRTWDGRFAGDSRAATLVDELRIQATGAFARRLLGRDARAWLDDADTLTLVTLLRALRERPPGWFADGSGDALLLRALRSAERSLPSPRAWRVAGATHLYHPLARLGVTLFDPGDIPGWGDGFTVKVQRQKYGQSFRAVWEPGDWTRGGMVFPLGESGRPRTPHYADLLGTWAAGAMEPYPLDAPPASEPGVKTLTLLPRRPR